MDDKKWHHVCTDYCCDERGRLFSKITGRLHQVLGSRDAKGYIVHRVRHNGSGVYCKAHRLVIECFSGQFLPVGLQVHHIDGRRDNNVLDNLVAVTPAEHNAEHTTHKSRCTRPVVRITYACGGEVEDIFSSVTTAVEQSQGVVGKKVYGVLAGDCLRHAGYGWRYLDTKLPGEVWRSIRGVSISNRGRIRNRNSSETFGTPTLAGYRETQIRGKTCQVHRLVAEAFHGPPESSDRVVDHIDGNPSNNQLENLRWATRRQNSMNTKRFREAHPPVPSSAESGPYELRVSSPVPRALSSPRR